MKLLLLRALLLFASVFPGTLMHAQITPGGVQVIIGTATSLGRGVRQATTDYKALKEQKELDANYDAVVGQADDYFAKNDYENALAKYQIAAEMKEDERVLQQMEICNSEIARLNRTPFDDFLDKGDSLCTELKYTEAIECYQAALKLKSATDDSVANQKVQRKLDVAKKNKELWSCVQFSNLLISDVNKEGVSSRAYTPDPFSDFMKIGDYSKISDSLKNSNGQSLDGIAIPAGVKLIIYNEPNFKGKVLFEAVGPMIINNISRNSSSETQEIQTKEFTGRLENKFPPPTRIWSVENMNTWMNGSIKIVLM